MKKKDELVWEKKSVLLTFDEFPDDPVDWEDCIERFNIHEVEEIKKHDGDIDAYLVELHNELVRQTGGADAHGVLQKMLAHPKAGSIVMAFMTAEINRILQRQVEMQKMKEIFDKGEFKGLLGL
jgi:hypothetical protein